MQRLRELRLSKGLTQRDLAARLATTQQTIGRWESGKAAPSIGALSSLAYILGTTVSHLLGKSTPARETAKLDDDADDPLENTFWGHIGILLPTERWTKWYPITSATRRRVWSTLRNMEKENSRDNGGWIVCDALNNRMIAFPSTKVSRIWLLDDDCDEPGEDWKFDSPFDDYSGMPSAIYRAMDEWAALESYGDKQGDDSADDRLAIAQAMIQKTKFKNDPEGLLEFLHYTSIVDISGKRMNYQVEPRDLSSALFDIEMGFNEFVYLPSVGGDFDSFFPLERLLLIDAPLLDAEAGDEEEFEGILADKSAESER